jgi:hypothetical protein
LDDASGFWSPTGSSVLAQGKAAYEDAALGRACPPHCRLKACFIESVERARTFGSFFIGLMSLIGPIAKDVLIIHY